MPFAMNAKPSTYFECMSCGVERSSGPGWIHCEDEIGASCKRTELVQNGACPAWADMLEPLATLCQGQADDLKVETSDLRVWLSRCGLEGGEPFARTVYVEANRGGSWIDLGYFDGDELDPAPAGTLGDALNETIRAAGYRVVSGSHYYRVVLEHSNGARYIDRARAESADEAVAIVRSDAMARYGWPATVKSVRIDG